jgi:hypothetical protein
VVLPEILREGIWHTTSVERFEGILVAGGILSEPPIPDNDRWGTACGPSLYPFVLRIGSVSVFDFSGFDEATYDEKYPFSMWRTFVPCFSKWDEAIWIELDRSAIIDSFVDGKSVIELCKRQGELGRKIMPIIEAAHIGPVPISAFRRIFMFSKHDQEFKQVPMPSIDR